MIYSERVVLLVLISRTHGHPATLLHKASTRKPGLHVMIEVARRLLADTELVEEKILVSGEVESLPR